MGKIIRIEDINGNGMYVGGSSACQELQDIDGKHPNFWQDDTLWNSIVAYMKGTISNRKPSVFPRACLCFKFGFKDVHALLTWVQETDILEDIQKEGFFLATYEVPDRHLFHGERQSMCLETHMECVSRVPLMSIFGKVSEVSYILPTSYFSYLLNKNPDDIGESEIKEIEDFCQMLNLGECFATELLETNLRKRHALAYADERVPCMEFKFVQKAA